MSEFKKIREIAVEMEELLRKHNDAHAEIPQAGRRAIDRGDRAETERLIKWVGFWGGAGTVDDLNLFEVPFESKYRVDRPDDERLRLLLTILRREMERLQILRPWPTR